MKTFFIGLGAMGYPMARHIARDHEVTVWNRTSAVARKHSSEHATRIASTLDDAAGSDVVITVLPTSAEVGEIIDAIGSKLARGTLWIDATSGDPKVSREQAKYLAGRGIDYVDAPVSGGPVGAEAGTLTVMVGGERAAFDRAEQVLTSCAKKIVHVGPIGAGHAIKVVTNSVMAANLLIASEALVALSKQGFDMKTALEVLNGSSGRSNVSENLLPQRLVHGEWPLLFKLSLLDKDVRIASRLLHDDRVAAPLFALTGALVSAASTELGSGADYIEVYKWVAAMSGERVG